MFRVQLVLQELVETPATGTSADGGVEAEDATVDSEAWEDVGRFTLRGVASTVGQFVSDQSAAFGQRMQAIVDLADAG